MIKRNAFLALAIPNVLTNLTVPLASLVDVAILGHLDDITPLAGVALAAVIFDFVYWSFGFLRMGATGLTAQAFGAGDTEESAGVFFRSFVIAMISGFIILALNGVIGSAGFGLLSGEPAVEEAGKQYFYARIWGAPATLGGYVVVGWLLGRQQARAALTFTITLNAINIVLNYVLVYKMGMGAAGAGYATMIAEVLAFFLGLWLVSRHWQGHPPFHLGLLRNNLGAMIRLQFNIMVRTFFLITTFSLFTNFSAAFGAVALAGNTVLLRFLSTAAWFIDGYAFALESLAGRYHGAGSEKDIRASLRQAMIWTTGSILLFIVLFLGLGEQMLGLLTIHADVVAFAKTYLPVLSITLLFSGFAYVYDGLFLGLSKGPLLRNSMALSTLIGFLPLAIYARSSLQPGLLWLAMILFMVLRTVTLGWASRKPLT